MKHLNTIYLILGMILSSAIHSIDITNKMKSHIKFISLIAQRPPTLIITTLHRHPYLDF